MSNIYTTSGVCGECGKPFVYVGDMFTPDLICQCNIKNNYFCGYSDHLGVWHFSPETNEKIDNLLEAIKNLIKELKKLSLSSKGQDSDFLNRQQGFESPQGFGENR